MSQTQAIAKCPNPKCKNPIFIDHAYSWCAQCGESLPNRIQAKLPRLQRIAADIGTEPGWLGASNQAQVLTKRYWNGYLAARVTVELGRTIKAAGVCLAVVILVGSAIFAASLASPQSSGNTAPVVFLVGGMNAALVGFLFYVLGVLISAQGQILKASVDSAVNVSPFLTDEHKARVMSLSGD